MHGFIFIVRHSVKPDVIHIHSLGTYSLFSCIPWILGIPFIVTPWGSDIIFDLEIVQTISIVVFFSNASASCDAIHIKELVTSISNKQNSQIINFGIDTSFFRRINKYRLNNSSNYRIISTRNHEPIYDINTLISALKILKDKCIIVMLMWREVVSDGIPD